MKKSDIFLFLALIVPASAIPPSQFSFTNPVISPLLSDRPVFDITAYIDESDSAIRFILETNHDLISHDLQHSLDDRQSADNNSLYLTKGSVWIQEASAKWEKAGWARLAVSQGKDVSFDGTFTIFDSHYEIQLYGSDMIAHRRSDFTFGNHTSSTCATAPELLDKRQLGVNNAGGDNLVQNIGDTSGCPDTRQVASIGIMTDCTYTASFNSSDSARRYILNMVNTASVVFENSFNISLSIQNLTISDGECPTGSTWNTPCSEGDLNSRLQGFSSWRSSVNDNNAYWTLLTGCSRNGGEVGVSWIGALCNTGSGSGSGSNGGASANVVARTQSEWQVFAHESAHTFGAVHDCTSATCGTGSSQCCPLSSNTCDAGGQYIMNPVSGRSMTRFSPCTIGNVCSRMASGQVDSGCLVGSRNGTGTTGQCGNGIVEAGEACDCGNGACSEQDTQCCDSVTCQLRGGNGCDRTRTGGTDGTGTGRGTDQGGSGGQSNRDSFSSWIDDHLTLVIGLAAGIGGALLLLVLGCIICSCRRGRPTNPKILTQR